jgi:fructose-1,6-bisphosphatase/inositol monophosphatase family enzyme
MDLRQDMQFAIELARGAGKIVSEHFGKVERLTKRHAEAVTEADRASQRHIVAGFTSSPDCAGGFPRMDSSARKMTPATPSPAK